MNNRELQERVYNIMEQLTGSGGTKKEAKKGWVTRRKKQRACVKAHPKWKASGYYDGGYNEYGDEFAGGLMPLVGPHGFYNTGAGAWKGESKRHKSAYELGRLRKKCQCKKCKGGKYKKKSMKNNPWVQFFVNYQNKIGVRGKEGMKEALVAYKALKALKEREEFDY